MKLETKINLKPLTEDELNIINGGSELSEAVFRLCGYLWETGRKAGEGMQWDSIHAKQYVKTVNAYNTKSKAFTVQ